MTLMVVLTLTVVFPILSWCIFARYELKPRKRVKYEEVYRGERKTWVETYDNWGTHKGASAGIALLVTFALSLVYPISLLGFGMYKFATREPKNSSNASQQVTAKD